MVGAKDSGFMNHALMAPVGHGVGTETTCFRIVRAAWELSRRLPRPSVARLIRERFDSRKTGSFSKRLILARAIHDPRWGQDSVSLATVLWFMRRDERPGSSRLNSSETEHKDVG